MAGGILAGRGLWAGRVPSRGPRGCGDGVADAPHPPTPWQTFELAVEYHVPAGDV